MFKYLWLVILGIVVLVGLVIAVIDVVTAFKRNWKYWTKEENGNILDVIEGTWDDIEEYVRVLIVLMIFLLLVASFVTFLASLGGAE